MAPQSLQVSVGFGAAAGVTMNGLLVTWGWSGYANEVSLTYMYVCIHIISRLIPVSPCLQMSDAVLFQTSGHTLIKSSNTVRLIQYFNIYISIL